MPELPLFEGLVCIKITLTKCGVFDLRTNIKE